MFSITVLMLFISPVLSFLLSISGFIHDTKSSKKYALLLALSVAALSFHLQANPEADGVRVMTSIYYYSDMPLSQIFNSNLYTLVNAKSYPLAYFIYWLVAQTGEPTLVYSISGFVQYFLVFYMFSECADKINAKPGTRAIVVLFLLTAIWPMAAITSFRFYQAGIIVLFSWYCTTIKKKPGVGIFLSILAAFIHVGYWPHLLILLLYILLAKAKTQRKTVIFISFALSLASSYIVGLAETASLGSILALLVSKFDVWTTLEQTKLGEATIFVGILVCLSYILSSRRLTSRKNSHMEANTLQPEESNFLSIMLIYVAFLAGSLLYVRIFTRYQFVLVLGAFYPFLKLLNMPRKKTLQDLAILLSMLSSIVFGTWYTLRAYPISFNADIFTVILDTPVVVFVKVIISLLS